MATQWGLDWQEWIRCGCNIESSILHCCTWLAPCLHTANIYTSTSTLLLSEMGSYSYASSTTTISDREEGMEIEKLLPYRYFLLLIPPAISMASYSFISTQTQVVRAHRFLVLVAHCSPKRICLFHTSRQHIAWLLYTDTTFHCAPLSCHSHPPGITFHLHDLHRTSCWLLCALLPFQSMLPFVAHKSFCCLSFECSFCSL